MKKNILKECLRIAKSENNIEKHSQYQCFSHWSFIVQDSKIVGYGKNRVGDSFYSGFGYEHMAKIHSEADAYRKVKGILSKNKPFLCINIRLNRQDELRISKPCRACYKLLRFTGCDTVWYSTDLGFERLSL